MGASPPNPNPHEIKPDDSCNTFIVFVLGSILLVLLALIFIDSQIKTPGFQLDFVSVNSTAVAAAWDIGFSIDRSVGDLSVRLQFKARDHTFDYGVEAVGMVGNAIVSVNTFVEELTLEKVLFRYNYQRYFYHISVCENVTDVISFSSLSSTQGNVMKGGPRLCSKLVN